MPSQNKNALKLHADAKEFVPSSVSDVVRRARECYSLV
jgi:hypothetical protein